MYCRICANVRQDKHGSLYCNLNGCSVGLNQVCSIGKFEIDKRALEEINIKGDE
jgi:hypothetical protein